MYTVKPVEVYEVLFI